MEEEEEEEERESSPSIEVLSNDGGDVAHDEEWKEGEGEDISRGERREKSTEDGGSKTNGSEIL